MSRKISASSSGRSSKPAPSAKTKNNETSSSSASKSKTAAFDSSLLNAETIQLESFIKNRSKYLDEEIEKMRIKLNAPSVEGVRMNTRNTNTKVDNKDNTNSRNENDRRTIVSDRAQLVMDELGRMEV